MSQVSIEGSSSGGRNSNNLNRMEVRGPSLTLRFATAADATRLFELGSDPEVTRFFSWGPYGEEAEALAYVESLEPKRQAGELLEFVVEHQADGIVGVTGLTDFSSRDRRATVGTWLGRPWWGGEVNRESKALILSLGFRHLGLHRISALTSPDNERSLAALAKLGFVAEGTLADWHLHGVRYRDCVVLRFLESDYHASDLAAVSFDVAGEVPTPFKPR
jgi:[ribosomal protein S5]-alanine N-acetyltransferase